MCHMIIDGSWGYQLKCFSAIGEIYDIFSNDLGQCLQSCMYKDIKINILIIRHTGVEFQHIIHFINWFPFLENIVWNGPRYIFFNLLIVALWRYMATKIWANIGSGNGSLSNSTKPLP